jgi:hypothetical protein
VKKIALAAVLLLIPLSAAAQMVKCVDERGRTHYTDKPEIDCKTAKSTTTLSAAPAPAKPPAPPTKAPSAKKPGAQAKAGSKQYAYTAEERAQFLAECKKNQDLLNHLLSPRGSKAENQPARVEMIKQAMRGCP